MTVHVVDTLVPAPTQAVPSQTLEIKVDADAARIHDWRARGADEHTIAFCAAMRGLDRIIETNAGRKQHVLVTSFPKSASTYLNKVLMHVTGFRQYWLNTAGHDNERNLEPTAIPMFLAEHTVTQEHMRATRANVAFLQRMRIRPVVLVRNIFDVIVSSRDHSRNGEITGPNAHTPADFTNWSDEEQSWFIIRMGLPWYFTFFTSWQDAQHALPALWITYEDVVQRTADTVRRILEHVHIDLDRVDVDQAVSKIDLDNVRFNRGVSGRGALELTADQIQAVRTLGSTYRQTYDFSLIGL